MPELFELLSLINLGVTLMAGRSGVWNAALNLSGKRKPVTNADGLPETGRTLPTLVR